MAKAPRPTLRLIDRLVLLVAWLVTCGLVYVLGYYVGRGTPDHRAQTEERIVKLPVTSTPPPEGQRPKEAKEFPSFYQALPGAQRPIDVARGAPVTAPPVAGNVPVATTLVPPTTLARSTTTLPPGPPPSVTRPTLPTTTTLVRTVPPPSSSIPRPTPPPPAGGPPPAGATPPANTPPATVPRTASRGSFTVEASPTRSRSEAEELLGTLRRKGYDASLVEVERDGDTWYRLRVGRYPTAEQATDAMRRLRDVEGVTHVFVAAD